MPVLALCQSSQEERTLVIHKWPLVFGATILLLASSIAAHAQRCSDKILSGGYSYQVVGQTGTEPPFLPFVSQRLVTFDGAGNLSGSGYRVMAGDVAMSPVTGTYSVQPDCSASFDITVLREDGSIVHVDQVFGVITDSGLKVHGALVSIVAPATLTITFEKVSQRGFSKSASEGVD